jgi:WD40 repeat protein
VFISYALSDGAEIAAALRQRLNAQGILLWQDLVALEGGRDWWLQITDALDNVEFMALVITPNALKSDTVRMEWRYARQAGVCVYPIKGMPDLDFATVPRWLRDKHFYHIENTLQWQKFVNDLDSRCQVPRVPFMVEDLPAEFVERPVEFERLINYLCDSKDGGPVAITAAVRGAGGYGKTILAKAVCHDEHVQDAFEDGILWVTLGENPGDLAGRVGDLVETLSGERPGFSDVNAGAVRLRELLAERDVLLVIDDVWDAAHLRPFLHRTGRGARLITTRNIDTLPRNASRVDVDAMRLNEAVKLLGTGLNEIDHALLRPLAARLGEWPLLLGIVSGALQHRINDLGQESDAALDWVNKALDRRGLTAFDARNPQAREQAAKTSLEVSIGLLEPDERIRYGELAIFPEDAEIPLATVTKLWNNTSGLDEFEAEALCERLDRLSLLQRFDPTRRVIGLHDVVRQYLIREQRDRLPDLHDALLDAHRLTAKNAEDGRSAGWAELPRDEPYLWDHLAAHLKDAHRTSELIESVKDLRYLAAKTVVRNALAVERDLVEAEKCAPADNILDLLRRRFLQSGTVLDRCRSRNEAEVALYSRLLDEPELRPLTQALVDRLSRPFLKPLHPLPDLPDPRLVRAFGYYGGARTCAASRDGQLIVSGGLAQTVKVWEVRSGRLLRTLRGHTGAVNDCALSEDGALVLSASDDSTLKLWDLPGGRLLQTLNGHGERVIGCALSGDGLLALSISEDKTVKVWETSSGALLRTLSDNSGRVTGCALSRDGRLAVSSSYDQEVQVWDVGSGVLLRTLSRLRGATSCALNGDGSLVLSGSWDGTVTVWETKSGTVLRTLMRHDGDVTACAVSEDGVLALSASTDCTLKVWEVETGTLLQTLSGHNDQVEGCALSADGMFVASASRDQTVKVWEVHRQQLLQPMSGHTREVTSCAVSRDGTIALSTSRDWTVKVWDIARGTLLRTMSEHASEVSDCGLSADGALAVSGSFDGTLIVWDVASGELLRTMKAHASLLFGCALSADGRVAASTSWDETVRVFDVATGELLRTLSGHTREVTSCGFSDDGALAVSAAFDCTLKLWDVASGALLQTMSGHNAPVLDCALSRDGTVVVSASGDKTVKTWAVASGALLQTMSGHTSIVEGCALSEDAALVVSVSDQSVRVWEASSGECLAILRVDGPLRTCAIAGDGERIVVGGARGVYFLQLVR